MKVCFTLALLFVSIANGQRPANSQTSLYFPHIASGGPAEAQLQLRLTFVNPNSVSVTGQLSLFGDSGSALALDFGSGPTSQPTFTIAPHGTVVLRNSIPPQTVVTGWAFASASLPIFANAAFRLVVNGATQVEITSEPTLPSTGYTAIATPDVGIAVANPYTSALPVLVTVFGGDGSVLGTSNLNLPPNGHTSFNLVSIPGLPSSFTGSVRVAPVTPGWRLIAFATYADSSGAISNLPDGRDAFPDSPVEQIQNAFATVVSTFQLLAPSGGPIPAFGAAPQLIISPENDANAINAFAAAGNAVTVNLALAELISDSPSELAWAIAHELGHIYQQRTGQRFWNADVEWDADMWGELLAMFSNYDPYASAGTLGKLGMATGTAGLGVQLWENTQLATDAHGSFSTRIDNMTVFIEVVCGSSPAFQTACNNYKQIVHPHFPNLPSVPLVVPKSAADPK